MLGGVSRCSPRGSSALQVCQARLWGLRMPLLQGEQGDPKIQNFSICGIAKNKTPTQIS